MTTGDEGLKDLTGLQVYVSLLTIHNWNHWNISSRAFFHLKAGSSGFQGLPLSDVMVTGSSDALSAFQVFPSKK